MSHRINDTLTLYQCGHEICTPRHSYGPAVRDHYLIHVIKKGKGTYYTEEGTYHLSKGQGFLITPHTTTTYTADEGDPWEYYWFGFDGAQAAEILSARGLDEQHKILQIPNLETIISYLETLASAYTIKADKETILGYLYLTLGQIPLQTLPLPENRYISLAMNYIHRNYSYDINVNTLSKYLALDRSYVYRLFKMQLGQSPREVIAEYRLSKAKHLLQSTNYSVTEVANSCGFSDPSRFSAYYHKKYGVFPSKEKRNTK